MKDISRIFAILSGLDGFLSEDALFLFFAFDKIVNTKGKDILEIGVFCGKSYLGLAAAFPEAKRIVGVDPFYEDFKISPALEGEGAYLANISHTSTPNERIEKIHIVSEILDNEANIKVSKRLTIEKTTQDTYFRDHKKAKFAICHVDGEHTHEAVTSLLNKLPSFMEDNGLVVIDDILNIGFPGIAEAIFTHRNYKKTFFPVIYAFNKGIFIYKSSEKRRLEIIHDLTKIFSGNTYTVRRLHDKSIMVYRDGESEKSEASNPLPSNKSIVENIKQLYENLRSKSR